MAHLVDESKNDLEVPILASPGICVEALRHMIAESKF